MRYFIKSLFLEVKSGLLSPHFVQKETYHSHPRVFEVVKFDQISTVESIQHLDKPFPIGATQTVQHGVGQLQKSHKKIKKNKNE